MSWLGAQICVLVGLTNMNYKWQNIKNWFIDIWIDRCDKCESQKNTNTNTNSDLRADGGDNRGGAQPLRPDHRHQQGRLCLQGCHHHQPPHHHHLLHIAWWDWHYQNRRLVFMRTPISFFALFSCIFSNQEVVKCHKTNFMRNINFLKFSGSWVKSFKLTCDTLSQVGTHWLKLWNKNWFSIQFEWTMTIERLVWDWWWLLVDSLGPIYFRISRYLVRSLRKEGLMVDCNLDKPARLIIRLLSGFVSCLFYQFVKQYFLT